MTAECDMKGIPVTLVQLAISNRVCKKKTLATAHSHKPHAQLSRVIHSMNIHPEPWVGLCVD